MKSTICFLVFVIAVLIACTRKTVPASTTNQNGTVPGTNEPVTGPVVTPNPATIDSLVFLADLHAGREIYTTRCTKCHELQPVAKWTVEEWKPILKSMIKKTKLDSLGAQQVTVYVNANAKKVDGVPVNP